MLNEYVLLRLLAQIPEYIGGIEVNYYYNKFVLTSDVITKYITQYVYILDIYNI